MLYGSKVLDLYPEDRVANLVGRILNEFDLVGEVEEFRIVHAVNGKHIALPKQAIASDVIDWAPGTPSLYLHYFVLNDEHLEEYSPPLGGASEASVA